MKAKIQSETGTTTVGMRTPLRVRSKADIVEAFERIEEANVQMELTSGGFEDKLKRMR